MHLTPSTATYNLVLNHGRFITSEQILSLQ